MGARPYRSDAGLASAPDATVISVLLPVRDGAGTLDAALRSVARQTERRWECLVVDDGSGDATLACARAHARRDPRVVVLPQAARGLVAALATGLARARGRVIARMDADDLMRRDRLAAQLAALDAMPALAAVGSHVRIFPRAAVGPGLRAYERWVNGIDSAAAVRREAFVECPVVHPTLMIRTADLRALGYRDVGWPEDYDLVLRLLASGREIGVVPRRLLAWREAPGRLTWTSPVYARAQLTACKAAFLADGFLVGSSDYVLWGYGQTGRTLARALRAHGKRPTHVVEVHPGRLGNVIDGAPVVPPEALPHLPQRPLVVSVAHPGPRAEIRAVLVGFGFRELHDFVCAA